MKAAFRGIRRKSSAGEAEHRRPNKLEEADVPRVPPLPQIGRASPMPSLRFSGFGLEQFMSNVGMDDDTSALDIEEDLAGIGSRNRLQQAGQSNKKTETVRDEDLLYFTFDPHAKQNSSPAISQNIPSALEHSASHNLIGTSDPFRGDSKRIIADPTTEFHLIGDDDDDRNSIEAVRNNNNNLKSIESELTEPAPAPRKQPSAPTPAPAPPKSIRRSFSQPSFERPLQSQPAASMVSCKTRNNVPVAVRPPVQPSFSSILESSRRTKVEPPPKSPASIATSVGPPTAPSLFAYEHGPGSGLKNLGKIKGAPNGKGSISGKTAERVIIRNARGEIEWKYPPPPPLPVPTAASSQHLNGHKTQQRGIPIQAVGGADGYASEARSTRKERPDRRNGAKNSGSRSPIRDKARGLSKKASSSNIPYKAVGAAASGADLAPPRSNKFGTRDGLMGMAASISNIKIMRMGIKRTKSGRDGLEGDSSRDDAFSRVIEASNAESKDQLKAKHWEQEREARNAADRQEAYEEKMAQERKLRQKEEEERRAMRKTEKAEAARLDRERREREAAELERQVKERKAAKREAKERAAKEAEERRLQEEKEAEERRIQEEKEEEERRIREEKEAKERRIRKAEEKRCKEEAEREKIRLAEEEAARVEAERIAAIEAEAKVKEDAARREIEAAVEEERQLFEARRQVDEEDRLARRAGRRDARRTERALAAGVDPNSAEFDEMPADDEALSDDGSEHFAEAKDVERSESGLRAPSSTDDSTDMPATPADEVGGDQWKRMEGSLTMEQQSSSDSKHKLPAQGWSQGDEAKNQVNSHVTFGGLPSLTESPETQPKQLKAKEGYRSDRFKNAIESGARRTAAVPAPAYPGTTLFANTEDDEDPQIVQPNAPYREGGITYGRGWCAHGLADPTLVIHHQRTVLEARPKTSTKANDEAAAAEEEEQEPEVEYDEVVYSDLGELIWSSTSPDVIARLVSHLDYTDVKVLRQTSQSIRFALGQLAGREIVLSRFLAPVGYRSWKPARLSADPNAPVVYKDPMPLSFSDCEAFLLSYDLLPEYHLVGAEYAKAAHKMDPRYPRLARATTRGYNRVLARLRMQPIFAIPNLRRQPSSMLPRSPSGTIAQQQQLSPVTVPSGLVADPISRNPNRSPAPGTKDAYGSELMDANSEALVSPWKPGRAAHYRVWVPTNEKSGWLSDSELSKCERELFIAGVWSSLKRGDVVWDCAVGDERNDGKYIFDGRYLRDLSFMFDRIGHLPSWINAFSYPPSYYHNIIRSSSIAQPVVYMDVLPWRDQIVSTMRLVQDQVETFSPQGARYRISKWLYRAVINVVPSQIISDEGLEVVDAGWHGRIVIETEGTAEHAKELISRCAGPAESAQTKARLLASVMDADSRPKIPKALTPTRDASGNKVETTTPWGIIRVRSRPGLIWLRPMDMRERIVF